VKLVWSQRALEDRRAIFDYIETDDPYAAVQVDDRIRDEIARDIL
jgi:plasmid stabilization system protein ParE